MKVKAALMKVILRGEIPSRIERAHPQGVPNRDFSRWNEPGAHTLGPERW